MPAILPAGIGLTHLRVYTSQAPDGQAGGSPHMHLACAELYYVLSGSGAVELLSIAEGYQRVELVPGMVVHFTPGVIHRLINGNGTLEILVLMQNSGLPEHGDAVLTFPPSYLMDTNKYTALATVREPTEAEQRRNLAVEGFCALRAAYLTDREAGRQAIQIFHKQAIALVRRHAQLWANLVAIGPAQALRNTERDLAAITDNDDGFLADGRSETLRSHLEDARRLGMCGRLWPYMPEGIVHDEGY